MTLEEKKNKLFVTVKIEKISNRKKRDHVFNKRKNSVLKQKHMLKIEKNKQAEETFLINQKISFCVRTISVF